MTTDLEKIRRLLERAAHESTPVEEARTSAVIAARLIIEHKVELHLPGARRAIFEATDLDETLADFFRNVWAAGSREQARPQERRQTFTSLCPGELHLTCTCCRAQVRPGSRMYWASPDPLIDDETVARVTHDGCAAHWAQKRCSACGKNTTRRLREKLTNQRRDPPGTTMSTASGYCYCCGQTYDVDEKIVCRGFVCVHAKCYPHFNRVPCPKCGGGARF